MNMQIRKTEPRRKHKQEQATQSAPQVNGEASATYTRDAQEMRQNLDAAIASIAADTARAAGPSLPLGQQSAHGVIRPGAQPSSGTQTLSSETLVQNFRQTPGE